MKMGGEEGALAAEERHSRKKGTRNLFGRLTAYNDLKWAQNGPLHRVFDHFDCFTTSFSE